MGAAIADKYLRTLTLRQLEVELGKYSDRERELLGKIVAAGLLSAIELGNDEGLKKVVKGISYLERKDLPIEPVEEMKNLFREYNEVPNKARQEIEESASDILLKLRISGSAIAELNINILTERLQAPYQAAQLFHDRLEKLKQCLSEPPGK